MAHSQDSSHSMPEQMTRIAVTLGVLAVYRLGIHLPCMVRGNALHRWATQIEIIVSPAFTGKFRYHATAVDELLPTSIVV